MSAVALATCEVQVSAADSQTVPTVASDETPKPKKIFLCEWNVDSQMFRSI